MSKLHVVVVSSYPPRRCGIATFANDLASGLCLQPDVSVSVVAIEPRGEQLRYGRNVIGRIEQGDVSAYLQAAQLIRRHRADVVSVQHEYGLWGTWQDELTADFTVPFIEELRAAGIPVVPTLHTIRPQPRPLERETLRGIIHASNASVVMARTGAMILIDDYGADGEKLVHIPHGVPVISRRPRRYFKRQLGLENRTIISTFGLLDHRKGIEYAISAMQQVVADHPEALYLVVGETHPEVRKREGELYRNQLCELVDELGLRNHVRFVNQYLTDREVVDYLQASDIYVTPYLSRDQITSGTLAFAVGTGKAIISTPYQHATEALAEGRGLLAEWRSADSIAQCLRLLLDDPEYRHELERRTAEYGKQDSWPQVGARYMELFRRVRRGEPLTDLLAVQPDPLAQNDPPAALQSEQVEAAPDLSVLSSV